MGGARDHLGTSLLQRRSPWRMRRSRRPGSAVSNGDAAETSAKGGGGPGGSREGCREGRVTHWLTEGLGLGGPHVQMGHHGLQPLTLLGELWRGGRWAGAEPQGRPVLFLLHQTPKRTPIPTTPLLHTSASGSRCPLLLEGLSSALHAPHPPHTLKARARGRWLCTALPTSLHCVPQARAQQAATGQGPPSSRHRPFPPIEGRGCG